MSGFENDIMFALNADFTQSDNQAPVEANGLVTNGQMWVGTTALNAGGTHVNVGQLTSSTLTIGYSSPNITINTPGGLAAIQTINGDTGSITGSTVTIFADNLLKGAGATVLFENSGTISTLKLSDILGNLSLGLNAGPNSTNSSTSTAIGVSALQAVTNGDQEVAVGYAAMGSYTGGVSSTGANTSVGNGVLGSLIDGIQNIALGVGAGGNYTSNESSNIIIGNLGTVGESNKLRIGVSGSAQGNVNQAFIAGITGVTAVGAPVAVASTGQLSSLGFGTAAQVLTSNGAGVSPTWQGSTFAGSPTYFQAYRTSNQTVAGGNTTTTIVFDTAISNVGSAYATGTGIFTAPATGYYGFSTTLNYANLTTPAGLSQVILAYTGSVQSLRLQQFGLVPATTGAAIILTASWAMPMTSGDTVKIQPFADGAGNYIISGSALSASAFNTGTTFSGWRIA